MSVRVRRLAIQVQILAALILSAVTAQAQSTVLLKCQDGTTSFWCADSANNALRVNVVATVGGGGAGFSGLVAWAGAAGVIVHP